MLHDMTEEINLVSLLDQVYGRGYKEFILWPSLETGKCIAMQVMHSIVCQTTELVYWEKKQTNKKTGGVQRNMYSQPWNWPVYCRCLLTGCAENSQLIAVSLQHPPHHYPHRRRAGTTPLQMVDKTIWLNHSTTFTCFDCLRQTNT